MLLRVSAAFFSLLSLKYLYISFFLSPCSLPAPLPAACASPCLLLRSPGAWPSAPLSPPFLPSLRLPFRSCCCMFRGCRVSSGGCRHSSAIRRKTVWQCGQMHRVYIPGLVSPCLCAAVGCSVASVRPSVSCPAACCLLSSGGNNSLYASILRAFAMRCSVWSVMLLLSIAV